MESNVLFCCSPRQEHSGSQWMMCCHPLNRWEALYEEHNLDIVCLMPTNVYGINDNFDKLNGHVIPAMISKFITAKKNNSKKIKLLGTGKPLREFIHSYDLAEAIIKCLNYSKSSLKKISNSKMPIINVGTGENTSILNLAKMISKIIKFKGKILFDKKSPDGTFKKNLNSRKILSMGWRPKIKLAQGLKEVIEDRLNQ